MDALPKIKVRSPKAKNGSDDNVMDVDDDKDDDVMDCLFFIVCCMPLVLFFRRSCVIY